MHTERIKETLCISFFSNETKFLNNLVFVCIKMLKYTHSFCKVINFLMHSIGVLFLPEQSCGQSEDWMCKVSKDM